MLVSVHAVPFGNLISLKKIVDCRGRSTAIAACSERFRIVPAFWVRSHIQQADKLSRAKIAGMRKAHLEIVFPTADLGERRDRVSRVTHPVLQIGVISA